MQLLWILRRHTIGLTEKLYIYGVGGQLLKGIVTVVNAMNDEVDGPGQDVLVSDQ